MRHFWLILSRCGFISHYGFLLLSLLGLYQFEQRVTSSYRENILQQNRFLHYKITRLFEAKNHNVMVPARADVQVEVLPEGNFDRNHNNNSLPVYCVWKEDENNER